MENHWLLEQMRQPGRSIYSDLTPSTFSSFQKTLLKKRNFNFKKEVDGQLLSQPCWAHCLSYEFELRKEACKKCRTTSMGIALCILLTKTTSTGLSIGSSLWRSRTHQRKMMRRLRSWNVKYRNSRTWSGGRARRGCSRGRKPPIFYSYLTSSTGSGQVYSRWCTWRRLQRNGLDCDTQPHALVQNRSAQARWNLKLRRLFSRTVRQSCGSCNSQRLVV